MFLKLTQYRIAGICCIILLFSVFSSKAQLSQDSIRSTKDSAQQPLDLKDVIRKTLFPKKKASGPASSTAILPVFGYNPSLGFQLGINISGAKYLGDPATTTLSVNSLIASVSSKGIITGQIRHNTFTKDDKWNLQGNWQLSRFITFDYGVGTGQKNTIRSKFTASGIPLRNDSGVYPIEYLYIRLNEKFYRKIAPSLSAGAGLSLDIRENIEDEKLDTTSLTPHYVYSRANAINPERYSTNGITINVQYITRDHPNRAYKGIYADLGFRINTEWLGSTKNSIQFSTEFRKYVSLSKKNPEHVLAFWHWGRYRISGTIPYLDLPGTGGDVYNRSGRAYTLYRFKGPSYFYLESEYRFPITRNKLLSGVVFGNAQTASNQTGTDLFEFWEPGVGAGLRILFNKQTRTNMCIDYAVGRNGTNGLFFGLNEVF